MNGYDIVREVHPLDNTTWTNELIKKEFADELEAIAKTKLEAYKECSELWGFDSINLIKKKIDKRIKELQSEVEK